ncbi:hypothetical protein ACFFX0_13080 [Citricoccus parietis]|uniref:Uncharacterized protein n=1 Tax=Citricoccus parietis TaxID=592307 RepID=A0ABV5G0P6_9MICC
MPRRDSRSSAVPPVFSQLRPTSSEARTRDEARGVMTAGAASTGAAVVTGWSAEVLMGSILAPVSPRWPTREVIQRPRLNPRLAATSSAGLATGCPEFSRGDLPRGHATLGSRSGDAQKQHLNIGRIRTFDRYLDAT